MMPQPEQQVYLVGAWAPLKECVPRSRYFPCQDCGEEVAIAPAGQNLLRQGALVLCVGCCRRREPPSRPIVTAAMQQEMIDYLGRPVTEKEIEAWIDQMMGD